MILIIGSGNAAFCAGIAALEKIHAADSRQPTVLIIEKADEKEWGGNSRYTAGAMRFAYNSYDDIKPLLKHPDDERLAISDFGSYTKEKFLSDLEYFNEDEPINELQQFLVDNSLTALQWLASHQIKFDPIYSRQTFKKDGKYIFWGGLSLEAEGEGDGLVQAEREEFLRLGGVIRYNCAAEEIVMQDGRIVGVKCISDFGFQISNIEKNPKSEIRNPKSEIIPCSAVILACGGFEANKELRIKYLGKEWGNAKVRGTRHNLGKGIEMAVKLGAALNGFHNIDDGQWTKDNGKNGVSSIVLSPSPIVQRCGCHAVPMDKNMPDYGNLDLPHIERKHYRKISYLFGVMLNANGERFVDEGKDFRNYTYAQFGKAVLEQPGGFAWQIFDAKVEHLLYSEYRTSDASFVEADTLEELVTKLEGVNAKKALRTLKQFNKAVQTLIPFDPTVKDGRFADVGQWTMDNGQNKTTSIVHRPLSIVRKSNWANVLDTPPFKAYPVTGGITFTYGGVKVNTVSEVLNEAGEKISGLFACGEMVGGVFFYGYPGGSGLTSGTVFGRNAGYSALEYIMDL